MVPYCVTVCTGCCVNATGNFILCERQVLVLLGIYHDETIHFGGAGWRSSSSPALCTTEPGFGPGSVRAFGFQSILASAGFSLGSPVFFLHLKLGFLNKSVSGIIWSYSASLSADWQPMALRLESFGRYVAHYKNPNLLLFFYFFYFYQSLVIQGCNFSGLILNSGFFVSKIYAVLFIFSPFWDVFGQFCTLFQDFFYKLQDFS